MVEHLLVWEIKWEKMDSIAKGEIDYKIVKQTHESKMYVSVILLAPASYTGVCQRSAAGAERAYP